MTIAHQFFAKVTLQSLPAPFYAVIRRYLLLVKVSYLYISQLRTNEHWNNSYMKTKAGVNKR